MNNPPIAPPRANLLILQKYIVIYKQWHEFIPHLPKSVRYTLGQKIDHLFIETVSNIYEASNSPLERKNDFLKSASSKLNLLKFFLQLCWEIKAININKYLHFSKNLEEIGKMLGGWQKQVINKTPVSIPEKAN